MAARPPVVVSMNVEGFGGSESETHEIPRAEWEAMTPADRLKAVDELASDHAGNYVGWGWNIADPDDYASVGDVFARPPVEITVEMLDILADEIAPVPVAERRRAARLLFEAAGFTVTDGGEPS